MDWFGAGGNGPLIAVRAIHFAATAITTGAMVFREVVAKPALDSDQAVAKLIRTQTLMVAWIGLAITVASGMVWFLFQATSMSGLPLGEAMTSSVLLTVLNQTQFGLVSEIRIVLAIILAACLAYDRFPPADWFAPAAALGLTAAIAWTGHAGSTLGQTGNLHLTADALHLVAAASWVGGLVSLVILLAAARRHQAVAWPSLARDATMRFSTLGVVSVATLLATGVVNAWILVGSFHALVVTEYGQLLMLKIVVFAAMLVFAAVNRFCLTPRLAVSSGNEPRLEALRQLTRNSAIEIVLGLAIFAIVGLLGTLHPAIHFMN
jgi:putative copper resistance protein D